MMRTDTFGLALLGTAALLLSGALWTEHVLGLAPCALCLMQRLWVDAVGVIACAGFVHGTRRWIYPAAAAAAAAIGGGFAVRQLYLQNLPPDQVPTCGPGLDYMLETFPASDVLNAMVFGTGNCAEVTWTFLGVSIAGWSLVGFIVVVILATLQVVSTRR